MGASFAKDSKTGALAGALGAVVSEIVADMVTPGKPSFEKIKEKLDREGLTGTREEIEKIYREEVATYKSDVNHTAKAAKLSAATMAFLLDQDVETASFTAANAIDNNFVVLAYYGVVGASLAYSAYQIYDTYEREGLESAVKQLGIEIALNLVGGKLVGVAGQQLYRFGKGPAVSLIQALGTALEKTPGLKLFLGNFADRLILEAEKISVSALGQVVVKLEAKFVSFNAKLDKIFEGVRGNFGNYIDANIRWGKGIMEQGMPWEDYLASQLAVGSRLPPNFKTFDFFDRFTGVATSAKTLNTTTAARISDPKKIYASLKKNIDDMVKFEEYTLKGKSIISDMITSRELHVAVPLRTTLAQWQQIEKAMEYAGIKGVLIKITKAK